MTALDAPTAALVRLAAAIATGKEARVRSRAAEVIAAGASPVWCDELLLQSVLMAGYPRALQAAHVWREVSAGKAVSLEDGGDWSQVGSWGRRGEEVCRTIYGDNYDKLRANVAALHPALDAWMVVEGYGRTLARPGLDLVRREFCVIAQVMVLEAERQLHSHLRGARNAGATAEAVDGVIEEAGHEASPAGVSMARRLWGRIR